MQISLMFGMLITILNKGRVSANELALKYEVCKRTVLRYMDLLCAAQIPIISHPGRAGGFSLADSFSLSRTYFTQEELRRLADSVNSMGDIFGNEVSRSLSDKLASMSFSEPGHILASDTVFIDSGPWGDVVSYRSKMNALEEAIRSTREVKLVYHDVAGRISKRTIQPYTLVFKQGIWYVYAFCLLRNDFRLFKLGRIASIEHTLHNFEKQPLNISDLPYNINWFNNENNINAVLKIEPAVRSEVEEWLSFENVISHKDGKIYAFARLPQHGLVSKLMSFGANVKVIEPASLRESLLKTVEGITQLYNRV